MACTLLLFPQIIVIIETDQKDRGFLFLSLCAVIVYHILQWPFCCSQDLNSTEGKTH